MPDSQIDPAAFCGRPAFYDPNMDERAPQRMLDSYFTGMLDRWAGRSPRRNPRGAEVSDEAWAYLSGYHDGSRTKDVRLDQ